MIEEIQEKFHRELKEIQNSVQLEALRTHFLGRKGTVQNLMQGLRDALPEERPLLGKKINDLKEMIERHLEERGKTLFQQEIASQLESEEIDITLPGRRRYPGRKHVITQTLDSMIEVFSSMGFSVQYGPDMDTDYYNFEALNFEEDHPARDMQDTFYLEDKMLLRTHTSNVQVRVMESEKPPLRIIAPGKVYRNEAISARSHIFFHQIEAFYIDHSVSFSDLLSTLDEFFTKWFSQKITMRYRPSYFPFVEPGLEADVNCLSCKGGGCVICKHSGWLEVAGAGMIHPEVLKNGGIDPEEYSGFALGLGVERLIMLKYGVKDIRLFTENNLRFLEQFTYL